MIFIIYIVVEVSEWNLWTVYFDIRNQIRLVCYRISLLYWSILLIITEFEST